VPNPVPGFSSGLRYEKHCAQIVPAIIECTDSLGSITSQKFYVSCPVSAVVSMGRRNTQVEPDLH